MQMPSTYTELDEGPKKKPEKKTFTPPPTPPMVEPYEPEKYWNQITSLRESRYIVVGRECLPDSHLVPVDQQMAVQVIKHLPHKIH